VECADKYCKELATIPHLKHIYSLISPDENNYEPSVFSNRLLEALPNFVHLESLRLNMLSIEGLKDSHYILFARGLLGMKNTLRSLYFEPEMAHESSPEGY